MTFNNKYVLRGNSQVWQYNGGCQYEAEYHWGKVDWHHPCSEYPDVGLYLCECHHSLLLGRKKKYAGEIVVNKSKSEMKKEIEGMVSTVVLEAGLALESIDKN